MPMSDHDAHGGWDGAGEKAGHEPGVTELRREAITMALYVAICLVAALAALPDTEGSHAHLLGIIWGVTIGLAVAHWFAFRVATRRVCAGRYRRSDVQLAAAQLVGAGAVAVLPRFPWSCFRSRSNSKPPSCCSPRS
jgi:hypothetical protein